MNKNKNNYQDFVIKDGEFIGEFDAMYREFDNPWNQSSEQYFSSVSRRSACHFIDKYQIKSLAEWGCGLGETTNYIKENVSSELDILGVDISQTAIQKASNSYPHINFRCDDIQNISQYNNYQCMFFSEITWYLLEDKKIDSIFNILSNEFSSGSLFMHQLSFYKNGIQKYGTDYFTNLDEFIKFCPFKLIAKLDCEYEDGIETLSLFEII